MQGRPHKQERAPTDLILPREEVSVTQQRRVTPGAFLLLTKVQDLLLLLGTDWLCWCVQGGHLLLLLGTLTG